MVGRKTSARFTDMLVYAQGFVSTAFVFAVGINNAGLGLSTDRQCHSAILVCIAMYGAAKIALSVEQDVVDRKITDVVSRYLFLLERVHIVRAPFIDRVKDPVWVAGAVLIVIGWAAITAYEYIAPRSQLSRVDGICRIGIRPDSAIAVIVLDTIVNVALAGVFIWQLRPALGSIVSWDSSGIFKFSARTSNRSLLNVIKRDTDEGRIATRVNPARNVKAMLFRNVIGSWLLLCAQIANNVLFLKWPYATHSHACQLMCLTDSKLGSPNLERETDVYSCIGYASDELADRALDNGNNRGLADHQHSRYD